ncbi:PepSY-associated TM helix domain-containing protein [Pseudomonas sp. BN102]|uniref:PepSY-associated TM helix domain-containing protein n=1 Tax=Pseudomonas sp. BN102 TaxID=2567886 RepID=UPI0024550BA6|nr:PepSY-associated TM helix domain-containing protein [Pseudomonas sp. BN102]MDH4610863.1 PepSY domain-containing protein [Pseudomonas sp. BN102]
MKKTFTQSMAWLHTWGGLLFGWLLFAIFLTGTLAVFDQEIDRWMRPEVPVRDVPQAQAVEHALAWLGEHKAGEQPWSISLPTDRSPELVVSTGDRRHGGGQHLDPASGEPLEVRDTAGGLFFFRFHFTLDLPRDIGIWVVGLAAMAILAALVSGIVIHKKIFKEFFTFRPGKGQRSWLDAHNASAVLLLPFHLMISYTGLVIFFLIYMPAALNALFDGDFRAYAEAQHGHAEERRAPVAATAAPLVAMAPILAEAQRQMGPVGGLVIHNPGRSDARIEVRRVLGNRIALTKGQNMVFHGVTGEMLEGPPQMRASQLTQRVMAGLHFAQFGGYPMRWLYFLCGLASCAMIATGLLLFTVKRRRRPEAEGAVAAATYRFAERANVAVIAGLVLAAVAYLWGNRLLPAELAQRRAWEVRLFFLVWALSLLHAWLRPWRRAWREQLWSAAALCAALPLLSALSLEQPWNDTTRVLLELTSVAMALALGWTAWRSDRPTPARASLKASSELLEAN